MKRDPLAELWERGFNVQTRKAKSGKDFTEAERDLIVKAHRDAFAWYVFRQLDPVEGWTWIEREYLPLETSAKMHGVSTTVIKKRRRRVLEKARELWRRWPYSGWRGNPRPEFLYGRAKRHG